MKSEYPNDIVMYPLGSFYEVLGDDAEYVANTLDLRSTYRNIGYGNERVPMCGFPDHVLEQYTQKLLDSGRNVVVVSVEDGEQKAHLIRSTATEPMKEVVAEQKMPEQPIPAPVEAMAKITQPDIDTALLHWNGNEDSKARVLAYMQDHSRERGTADWLKNEYGGTLSAFTVTKGDLSVELPWTKVQRHIGQLVAKGAFTSLDEPEQPVVEAVPSNTVDITLDMYDTQSADIFKVKENSYLVSTEIKATQEIWERFADNGLTLKEDSEQRIIFETDGKDWNRFFIPDTYGNKWNNINALDVLTSDEVKTMWAVVQRVLPAVEQQAEITPIPYKNGDTVYLENGTPFLVEEITDNQVTLRDPSLFYPVLRAESRESFLQLLERYPQTKAVQEQVEDFHITNTHLGEGNKREKFQRNIAAITTLQTLERENRFATKEEQETLSQYVGWGGLPDVFDETKDNWHSEYLQLKDVLTENEYDMARASTLNAHYTSPTVIQAIYDAVGQMGFTTGNILEPACGTGHFFGMLPENMQDSNLYGVELDSITGRIAKQLYPSANIAVTGFEKTDLPDSFFDLAIGNVPFGNYKLSEKRYDSQNFLIHDHFFAKALDKVRPGGVVAFVTSKGTMDKKNPEVRRYLAQRAELLGAIRLPNNAFSKNAGTEVTSDIIFLQKRDNPIDVDRDWIHLGLDENGISLNSYFAEHPEMILGNMEMVSGQFGMESACVPTPGAELSEQLKTAVRNIEGEISEADLPDIEISEQVSLPADPNVKNHTYTLVDGEVYFRENSRMVKPALNQTAKERVAGLVELRECVNDLINYQLEDFSDEVIKAEQVKLNRLYDTFTAKYGLINSRGNSLAFSEDNSYYLLCSLEDVDEDGKLKAKADMFTKRTIKKAANITSVDTPSEALAVSIAEKAKVDLSFMAELTGLSEEEIAVQLKGVIFRVPELYHTDAPPHYVTADEYLSGNVREKLRTAQLAAKTNEDYKGYRQRTRFSKFFNLPELMSMFKEVADIKTADELNLPTPEVVYETVVAKPTEIQQELVQELSERAAKIHNDRIDPSIDNMLKVTSDGRKLGLDQRVINPMLPDDENSKVNTCINNIMRIWEDGKDDKLTQLLFCDLSTPKGRPKLDRVAKAGGSTINGVELHTLEDALPDDVTAPEAQFSVYEDIRDKLIAKGMPASEVAFIHEANTDTRKKELFAKVRSGDVRVLLGSTAKCGAGMNVQDRLVALHDLDCPWRPGDLTQRSGRIIRQGNENEQVKIFRYVTEDTFDAYLWQTVENKQKFISQIMTSKSPVRSCEDIDEAALSYAEIKALCAGNPLIKEKMDLDIEVARLKLLKANHQSTKYRLEDNLLKHFPESIERHKGYIKGFEQDIVTLAEHTPKVPQGGELPKDDFRITIKGDTLTDKDNAGAAILEACKEIKNSDPVEIGSYKGFTMYLSYAAFGNEHTLTLKGAMSHTAKLGLDARGNLTRIDNALNGMQGRLQAVQKELENLYNQQAAAKLEVQKPFVQEQELKDKTARLVILDKELNMSAMRSAPSRDTEVVAKRERPSILDSLKQPSQKGTTHPKKFKPEREER